MRIGTPPQRTLINSLFRKRFARIDNSIEMPYNKYCSEGVSKTFPFGVGRS